MWRLCRPSDVRRGVEPWVGGASWYRHGPVRLSQQSILTATRWRSGLCALLVDSFRRRSCRSDTMQFYNLSKRGGARGHALCKLTALLRVVCSSQLGGQRVHLAAQRCSRLVAADVNLAGAAAPGQRRRARDRRRRRLRFRCMQPVDGWGWLRDWQRRRAHTLVCRRGAEQAFHLLVHLRNGSVHGLRR